MKRAKVSAVYEGKGRKRKRAEEEDEEEEGKKARQRAKARKYGSRANARTPYRLPTGRKIMKRSMATISNLVVEKESQEMGKVVVEKENQEMGKVVVEKENQEMGKVVVEEEEEKTSETKDDEVKSVGEVVEMLEEELKRLDWPPVSMSYEEEHWLGLGTRWDPYCDLMTGDEWVGGEGVEENDWVVNIWDN